VNVCYRIIGFTNVRLRSALDEEENRLIFLLEVGGLRRASRLGGTSV
jgi:hypothetical protein